MLEGSINFLEGFSSWLSAEMAQNRQRFDSLRFTINAISISRIKYLQAEMAERLFFFSVFDSSSVLKSSNKHSHQHFPYVVGPSILETDLASFSSSGAKKPRRGF